MSYANFEIKRLRGRSPRNLYTTDYRVRKTLDKVIEAHEGSKRFQEYDFTIGRKDVSTVEVVLPAAYYTTGYC
jgi:hypothetical protein